MEEEEKRARRKTTPMTFNQVVETVSRYVDQTHAIKNLDKKRKKGVPKLKEDKKKEDDGTVTLQRVESTDGKCFKCNEKGHFARDCSAKVECETCHSDRHVTALHRDDPRQARSRSRSREADTRSRVCRS